MEENSNYNWDTNEWIKNNHGKPMWKLWSSATPLSQSNHELPALAIPSTSIFSGTIDGLDNNLSVHTITDSPLILSLIHI